MKGPVRRLVHAIADELREVLKDGHSLVGPERDGDPVVDEVGNEPAPAGEEEPEEVVYKVDARLDGECGRGRGGPVTDLEEGPGCFIRGELDLVLGPGVEGLLVRHRPDRHEQIAEIVDGSWDIGHDVEAGGGSGPQHSEGGAAGGAEDELVGG